MGKRQKEWARKARDRLFEELGRLCAECGATENLQFDCKVAQGHEHHRMDFSARICFYRKQHYEHGNIQVLCASCNTIKSHQELRDYLDKIDREMTDITGFVDGADEAPDVDWLDPQAVAEYQKQAAITKVSAEDPF